MWAVLHEYGKWKAFITVWSLGLLLVASGHAEETIAAGKRVALEYTLTLEDHTVFHTNVGKDPLVYTHGSNQIVPGLEKQLTGLQVRDTKEVEVSPEDGYGALDRNRAKRFQKRVSRGKCMP